MASTEPTRDAGGRAGIFPPAPRLVVALAGVGAGAWCGAMVALSLAFPHVA